MRRLNVFVTGAVLLLLAAFGVWFLSGGGDADRESAAVLGRAVAPTAGSELGAKDVRAREELAPVAADDGAAARAAAEAANAATTAPPPAASADDSLPALFHGRVVDDVGAPIAGATVVYWPNEDTLPLYGVDENSSGAALDVLPRALTDGGGRFTLEARHRLARSPISFDADPMLVVVAGDFAIRSLRCKVFTGGERDVGDIALEPGARLTGRVVDSSGLPIAGATIRTWNADGRSLRGVVDRKQDWFFSYLSAPFAATTSGADGRFATGPLWQGTVQLGVTAEGFIDLWRDGCKVDVGGKNDLGDVVLDRGAALAGFVHDAQGAPVAGARTIAWAAFEDDAPRNAAEHDALLEMLLLVGKRDAPSSGADGRFTVPALPPANHSLLVDAEGFEPLIVQDLLPGGPDLSLGLTRAATLKLTVLDQRTREPVVGATVHARRQPTAGSSADPGSLALPVRAGEGDGAFIVQRLGLVRTTLNVEAPGHATAALALDGVTPPAVVERTLQLLPEARITGTIMSQDGTPIAVAAVVAVRDDGKSAGKPPPNRSKDATARADRQDATSDAQGRYALTALAPGDWLLKASAPEFARAELPVTVTEGQSLQDIDLALTAAASIFGTCYAADGTLDAGATKSVGWVDPEGKSGVEQLRSVRSDEHGRYEVRDLRPGTWRLSGDVEDLVTVTLVAGERRELDLRKVVQARVSGRILSADGSPVHGAWLQGRLSDLSREPGLTGLVITPADEEGRFDISPAAPGHYAIVGTVPGPDGGVSAITEFDLAQGEQRVVELRLGNLVIRGRLLDAADESPVVGATAFAQLQRESGGSVSHTWIGSAGEGSTFGASTDADGRFELQHLVPGRYVVSATVVEARAEELPPLLLAPGAVPDVVVHVTRTATIRGTVRTAAGVPLKLGYFVFAEGDDPKAHRGTQLEDGKFELGGLLPGTWRLRVGKSASDVLSEQSVSVASGQHLDLELIVP